MNVGYRHVQVTQPISRGSSKPSRDSEERALTGKKRRGVFDQRVGSRKRSKPEVRPAPLQISVSSCAPFPSPFPGEEEDTDLGPLLDEDALDSRRASVPPASRITSTPCLAPVGGIFPVSDPRLVALMGGPLRALDVAVSEVQAPRVDENPPILRVNQRIYRNPRVVIRAVFPLEGDVGGGDNIEVHFSLFSYARHKRTRRSTRVPFRLPESLPNPDEEVDVYFGLRRAKTLSLRKSLLYESTLLKEYMHGSWDNCASGEWVLICTAPSQPRPGAVDVGISFRKVPFAGNVVNAYRYVRSKLSTASSVVVEAVTETETETGTKTGVVPEVPVPVPVVEEWKPMSLFTPTWMMVEFEKDNSEDAVSVILDSSAESSGF